MVATPVAREHDDGQSVAVPHNLVRAAALSVAVLFAVGVVYATGELFFFGSSKIRPLFGMNAEALEGRVERLRDAGADDAGSRY